MKKIILSSASPRKSKGTTEKKMILSVRPRKNRACCRGSVLLPTGKGTGISIEPNPANCQDGNCCRQHMVDVVGGGRKKFPFPTKEKAVRDVSIALSSGAISIERAPGSGKGSGSGSPGTFKVQIRKPKRGNTDPTSPSESHDADITAGPQPKINANAYRVAAEVIRQIFHQGRFDADVANKFGPLRGACKWALKNMDQKYQGAITSLDEHLQKLEVLYRESIPDVMNTVKAQHPEMSEDELRMVAVELLDQQEELAQILYVLNRWVVALGQYRDGMYKQLQAVVDVVGEAFNLFFTGDIDGSKAAGKAILKSTNFLIGNVFLAHAGSEGPATIPGTQGPVGAHLVLVPQDELSIIMLMMVLYLHEFRHDVFADVEGLAQEEAAAVERAIREAYASGQIKLSAESIKVSGTKLALVDLLVKLFLDNLGEIDADLVGGIEMSGWSFALNMAYVFGAFNTRSEGAIHSRELLLTSSHYEVSKKGELAFEPHPPDYFRLYLNAASLELIGFPEEAAKIRAYADVGVGTSDKPEFITWVDMDGRRKPIQIRFSDLVQLAPVVAEAILNTPFKALNGKSNHDIVAWTPKRELKKQRFVQALLSGKLEIPQDIGDVYCTLVAAAAAEAYFIMIENGRVPSRAASLVNDRALSLHAQVLEYRTHKATDGSQPSPSKS